MATNAHSLVATLYATWEQYAIPAIFYHYFLTAIEKFPKPQQILFITNQIKTLNNNNHPYQQITNAIEARQRSLKYILNNINILQENLQEGLNTFNYQTPPDFPTNNQYKVVYSQQSPKKASTINNLSPKQENFATLLNHLQIYKKVTIRVIELIVNWKKTLKQQLQYDEVVQFLYHHEDYFQKISKDTLELASQYSHIFDMNPFLTMKKLHSKSQFALVYQTLKSSQSQQRRIQDALIVLSQHENQLLRRRMKGLHKQKGFMNVKKLTNLEKIYSKNIIKEVSNRNKQYYDVKLPFSAPWTNKHNKQILTKQLIGSQIKQSRILVNSTSSRILNYTERKHPVYVYDAKNKKQIPKKIPPLDSYSPEKLKVIKNHHEYMPVNLIRRHSSGPILNQNIQMTVDQVHGKLSYLVQKKGIQDNIDRNRNHSYSKRVTLLANINQMKQYRQKRYDGKGNGYYSQKVNKGFEQTEYWNGNALKKLVSKGNKQLQAIEQSSKQITQTKKNEKQIQQQVQQQSNQLKIPQNPENFIFEIQKNVDQNRIVGYLWEEIFENFRYFYAHQQEKSLKEEINSLSKRIIKFRHNVTLYKIYVENKPEKAINTSKMLVGFAAIQFQEKGRRLKRTATILAFKKFIVAHKMQIKMIQHFEQIGYGIVIMDVPQHSNRQLTVLKDLDMKQPFSYPLISVSYNINSRAAKNMSKKQLKAAIVQNKSLKHSRILKYYYYSEQSVYHNFCNHSSQGCKIYFHVQSLKKIFIDGETFYQTVVDQIKVVPGGCYKISMHLNKYDLYIAKTLKPLTKLEEVLKQLEQQQQQQANEEETYHYLCLQQAKIMNKYLNQNESSSYDQKSRQQQSEQNPQKEQILLLKQCIKIGSDMTDKQQDRIPTISIGYRANKMWKNLIIRKPYYFAFICKEKQLRGKTLAIMCIDSQ